LEKREIESKSKSVREEKFRAKAKLKEKRE